MKSKIPHLKDYIIAFVLVLLMIPAEYLRISSGEIGIVYWALAIPSLLSIYFVYRAISSSFIEEETAVIQQKKKDQEPYNNSNLWSIRCKMLSISAFCIAAVAFFISFVIRLLV
jgi:hypothetical protein